MNINQITSLKAFNKLSDYDKALFLHQKVADLEVINGLIADRRRYRSVVKKLTDQLVENGIEPCTDYFKESGYNKLK